MFTHHKFIVSPYPAPICGADRAADPLFVGVVRGVVVDQH